MRFLLTLPVLLATAQATVSPTDIIVTLQAFRDDALKIQKTASEINVVNGPLLVVNQGPLAECTRDLQNAAASGNAVGAQLGGTPIITDTTDANNILAAYKGFAQAHVALFDQMTRRAGVMRLIPRDIGPSVTKALMDVRSVIYGLTDFLEATVPSVGNAIETQFRPLIASMEKAKEAYTPYL